MDFGKYRKNKNWIQIWKRRALMAGIMLSLIFFIIQFLCLMNEYEKKKGIEILQQFSDYYEFEPNSLFAAEALKRYGAAATSVMLENEAKVYTEYLAKWANEPDVDILRVQLCGFFGKDDLRVYSYVNQKAYEMAWDDFKMPLSEGRWFEGNEDEVISFQGNSYKVGDSVKLEDKNGNSFEAVVVGKTCYPYMPNNTLPISSGVHNSLYKPADDLDIFLLNPKSEHNTKSDSIKYNTTLIKTDNEIFLTKNSQYGVFTPVKLSLKEDKVSYVTPAITMAVGLIFFVMLFLFALFIKEHKGMIWYIWIAGVVGGLVGSVLYYDAPYKFGIVVSVCTIISLIYCLVNKKKIKEETSDEIEVVVLQKDAEWEETNI